MRKILSLIGSIAMCQGAGAIGALFSRPAIPGWYETLVQPSFAPPRWLFAPVWLVLYTMMGIAFFRVRCETGVAKRQKRSASLVFFVQLGLNVLWSIVFFGGRSIGGGMIVVVALWFLIAATARVFYKISRPAAWLLLPYFGWVSFAVVLNIAYYALNR